LRHLAFLAVLATPVAADYSDHPLVELFTVAPCTEAIATIDQDVGAAGDFKAVGLAIGRQGAAWGTVLGFDTALGGLQGDEETTLIRLRKACAESPETPAADLLMSFN